MDHTLKEAFDSSTNLTTCVECPTMLLSPLILPLLSTVSLSEAPSLLAMVPEDAYALVHCRDISQLRARADRNDWYRLLGTQHGEPFMGAFAQAVQTEAHGDLDELLAMADALEGEVVFFDAGSVAGFITTPPANRDHLVQLVSEWLPEDGAVKQPLLEVDGSSIQLAAWPADINGWEGRKGHFAAFVDHPEMIAIYSGDSLEAVTAALTECLPRFGRERRVPLVSSYLKSGGGQGAGPEAFIDFTPLVDAAEAELKRAVEGVLPDPTDLLGLEKGTWLHVSADLFPGARVDCNATLHIPPGTLAASLADTYKPLPHALPSNLPKSVWGLYALHWDIKEFYGRARAAVEKAGRGEAFETLDSGLEISRGYADVDPVVDVLNQLAGDFAVYMIEPEQPGDGLPTSDERQFTMLGIYAGLLDGEAFHAAIEKLFDAGGLANVFDMQEVAGVDAYVIDEEDEFDGGIAFMPQAFSIAISRRVLERSLRALSRAEGASLIDGSRMQAAIDENSGACFLACVEMAPLREYMFSGSAGDMRLPPLQEGQPARDPFDSQLVTSARRTKTGFTFRLLTR